MDNIQEMELTEIWKDKNIIRYKVTRKGLYVGILSLEAPYNEERKIKKLITLHNGELKC